MLATFDFNCKATSLYNAVENSEIEKVLHQETGLTLAESLVSNTIKIYFGGRFL